MIQPHSVGALFAPLFAGALFPTVFGTLKKQIKGHSRISEEKMTKISVYVFLFGSFFYKREKYLLTFVFTVKFSMFFTMRSTTFKILKEISEL